MCDLDLYLDIGYMLRVKDVALLKSGESLTCARRGGNGIISAFCGEATGLHPGRNAGRYARFSAAGGRARAAISRKRRTIFDIGGVSLPESPHRSPPMAWRDGFTAPKWQGRRSIAVRLQRESDEHRRAFW